MKPLLESQYLDEMEAALRNLAEVGMDDAESEQMGYLVNAFFKQEVAMHSREELQARFSSAEKLIESFRRFLSGQKWNRR